MPSAGPKRRVSEAVLDASAILALINGEPGAMTVRSQIRGALVTAVNLTEVVSKLVDDGTSDDEIDEALSGLRFVTVPFDQSLAVSAGKLRRSTRRGGSCRASTRCGATT